MMKQRKLADSRTLMILPVLIALAFAAVISLLIELGDEQRKVSSHMMNKDMPAFQFVERSLNDLTIAEGQLYRLLLMGSAMPSRSLYEQGRALADRIERQRRELEQNMRDYLSHFADEHRNEILVEYQRLLNLLDANQSVLSDLLRASEGGKPVEMTTYQPHATQILEMEARSSALRVALTNAMHREYDQFTQQFTENLQRTTVIGCVVFLLITILSLRITSRMRTNLDSMGHALHRVLAEPKSIENLVLPSDPEFEALTQVARKLARAQDELRAANEELEEERRLLSLRVSESTDHLLATNESLRSQIEKREKAEKNLRLYKTIVDSTDEAILITDGHNRIIEVNPAYEESTGFARSEVIGQDPGITRSGRHDQAFYKQMWQSLEDQGTWRGEVWDRRKNGDVYPKLLTINAHKDRDGRVLHYIGIFRDISEQKENEKKLAMLAFNDPLTGLPNRALFRDRLNHELERSVRTRRPFSLFFIDLDGFKPVNDEHGHDVGDALLIQVSGRIRGCLRQSDTLARLGGDEFTVILPDSGDLGMQRQLAQKIIDRIRQPFSINGVSIQIGASIGIARFPEDGTDYLSLTRHADLAMYKAKQAGKGQSAFYSNQQQGDFPDSPKVQH